MYGTSHDGTEKRFVIHNISILSIWTRKVHKSNEDEFNVTKEQT